MKVANVSIFIVNMVEILKWTFAIMCKNYKLDPFKVVSKKIMMKLHPKVSPTTSQGPVL